MPGGHEEVRLLKSFAVSLFDKTKIFSAIKILDPQTIINLLHYAKGNFVDFTYHLTKVPDFTNWGGNEDARLQGEIA
jgi:hypothetical protein